MAHELLMKKVPTVNIVREDVEFEVRKNDQKLGDIHLSQGGVEWFPAFTSPARSGSPNIDWATFGRIMEAYKNGDLSGY